jgi:ABC-type bacteriocin/lantibiotic exporter with double-glycine peptidase domain
MQYSYLSFLKKYLLNQKKVIIVVLITTIIQSIITMCIPLTYKELIDRAFPKKDFSLFIQCVSAMVILFFINSLLNILKDYLLAKIVERLSFTLRKELNDKLSYLPYKFFDDHKLSDILSRYNKEIDVIKQNCGYMTVNIFSNIITTLFASTMILFFDWRLLVVSMLIIVFYISINRYFGKKVKEYAGEAMKSNEYSVNQIMETYNNVLITKIYSSYNYVEKKFMNAYKRQYDNQMKLELTYSTNINLSGILIYLLSGVIWIIGGVGVFANKYTVGTIISLLNYQNMLLGTTRFFSEFNNSYQGTLTAIERLQSIFNEVEERAGGIYPPENISEIILDGIYFSYSTEKTPVLINVYGTMKKGEITAIIGPSGSGKSTVTKLLLGLYKPQKGSILINNNSLNSMDLALYRKRTAYIPQDSLFFNDSILNNIGFEDTIDPVFLEEISKTLGLYDEIMGLPLKWNTILNPGGSNISGGQKKRVDILRALIRNAEIIIFDEPTASLDMERRISFLELLTEIKSEKIIILITHNKEESYFFDKIYSVKNGELLDCTTEEWRTITNKNPVSLRTNGT